MHTRSLGRSDITIAPIVFGGNVFGWTADEATSFALLDRFIERGFNAVDTADAYSSWADGNSGGESETTIGKWLAQRGRRDDGQRLRAARRDQPSSARPDHDPRCRPGRCARARTLR